MNTDKARIVKWYRDLNTKIEKSGLDWVIHCTVGFLVTGLLIWLTPVGWLAPVAALAVACFIEAFDLNWDWKDVSEYVLASIGLTLIYYFIRGIGYV